MASIKHKICSTYSHQRLCFLQKTSDQQRHFLIIIQMIFTLPGSTMTIHDPLGSNANTKHRQEKRSRDKVSRTPESWSLVSTFCRPDGGYVTRNDNERKIVFQGIMYGPGHQFTSEHAISLACICSLYFIIGFASFL